MDRAKFGDRSIRRALLTESELASTREEAQSPAQHFMNRLFWSSVRRESLQGMSIDEVVKVAQIVAW